MIRWVLFLDVDGTLVPSTSTGAHIARTLGHGAPLAEAEAAYARGELSNESVCAIDAAAWAGRDPEEVALWLDGLPLVEGIHDVVRWCREHDVEPVLSSLAWEPVTHALAQRLGVIAAPGPRLEVIDGRFTGRTDRVVEAESKRNLALEEARMLGVPPSACAHVGDGRSDVPLFDAVGLSIAFNAAQETAARTTVGLRSNDLRSILPALRAWVTAMELSSGSTVDTAVEPELGGRHEDLVCQHLTVLLDLAAPAQFVPFLLPSIADACRALGLPEPQLIAGNIVVGDLGSAMMVLSAHLDEASFVVTGVDPNGVRLAACHRLPAGPGTADLEFVGIRQGAPMTLGRAQAEWNEVGSVACPAVSGVTLGDRAVYYAPATRKGAAELLGKAIDDRAGAMIALDAYSILKDRGIQAAVVLSDGEQSRPEGYFSRTFPAILRHMRAGAPIVFVDGMFNDAPGDGQPNDPPSGAFIVPHTSDGMGYLVPPLLFALLRDEIQPAARAAGLNVELSAQYHSRGDDWGLVTNPAESSGIEACFVSFVGGGSTPAHRAIDLGALRSCADTVVIVAEFLAFRPASVSDLKELSPEGRGDVQKTSHV